MTRLIMTAAIAALAFSLTNATPVHAAEDPEPGAYALPSGNQLFPLYRWLSPHSNPYDHRTGPGPQYYNFINEGPLGKAAHGAFPNSRAIYSCAQSYAYPGGNAPDRFTSNDPGCEGKYADNPHAIGFISNVHVDGTTPLFRCFDDSGHTRNHFDSLSTNCEGKRTIGILGFVIL